MSAPTKDLCTIQFTETTTVGEVKRRVLNAFLEGYNCFLFRLAWKTPGSRKRIFEERVALDPSKGDEATALEMAEFYYLQFCNTVGMLAIGKL
jgi:hypothetical protein